MSGEPDADGGDARANSDGRANAAWVVLAALALLLAAVAVPPLATGQDGPSESAGETDGPTAPGGPGGESGDGSGSGSGTGDGTATGEDGTAPGGGPGGEVVVRREGVENESGLPGEASGGCYLLLSDRPVPGIELTVQVWQDGSRLTDRAVRFGDRAIGRTDASGRVTGRIPYERSLDVAVAGLGTDEECTVGILVDSPDEGGTADSGRMALATGAPQAAGTDGGPGDGTVTVPVRGEVEITVAGNPRPGRTVTLEATIAGEPMRDAAVAVDGRRVGRTDDAGRYRLGLPDDGSEQLHVAVSRGDFQGERTIRLDVLAVSVEPVRYLAVPGAPARVRVTAGGDPVAGATVNRAGERVGVTGPDGSVDVKLPADGDATYTASGAGQTARADLYGMYLQTALTSLLVLAVATLTTALVHRRRGSGTARVVGVGWLAILVPLGGWIARGGPGAVIAGGTLAAVVGFGLVRRERRRLGRRVRETPSRVRALWRWWLGGTFALAGWLATASGRLTARLRRLGHRLRSRPTSLRDIGADIVIWVLGRIRALRAIPGGSRRAVTILHSSLRRLWSPGRAVALAAAAGGVGVATWQFGSTGLLAALAVCATLLAAGIVLQNTRDGTVSSTSTDAGPPGTGPTRGTGGTAEKGPPSIRECWRAFASRVDPESWRTRSPAEVARRAVRRGYPIAPVAELTAAFREVEYGGRASEDASERAVRAYERLNRADTDTGGSDESR